MQYERINMETYPRKNHFDYFKKYAYPYDGMTAEIDVTGLKKFTKERGYSFFLSATYIAAKAANCVPEFRMRIKDNGIIQYPNCGTSHVVLLPDNTFCYCRLYYDKAMSFDEFMKYAVFTQEKCKEKSSIADDDETDSLFFISAIPWVHYTNLVQAVPCNNEANPRISFGKYENKDGKLMMPLTVLAHHALVDGFHIGQFYQYVEKEISIYNA